MLKDMGLKIGDKVSLELDDEKFKLVIKKAKSNAQQDLGLKLRHRLGESVSRKE